MIIAILTIIVGCYISLTRYNFVAYVIALEIILLGVNLNFLFAMSSSTAYVHLVNFILLVIAALETVVGLSLVVNLHRSYSTTKIPKTGFKG
jgi:NADH:ubiquinone oxidoreductase subunit K